MTAPQIPSIEDLFAKALRELRDKRPAAYRHFVGGTYGNVITGLKAQAKLELSRIADAAAAGRLPTAEKADLLDLAASEFDIPRTVSPTKAIGTMVASRSAGTMPQGTIPKGTRIHRTASTVFPILADASYVTTADVFVPQGATQVTLTVEATTEGSFANDPVILLPNGTLASRSAPVSFADKLFDTNFNVISEFYASGGSDGPTDDEIRRFATYYYQGQYAPTDAAILAGLYDEGVRNVYMLDDGSGTTKLWVADSSWACSPEWLARLNGALRADGWLGFGCSIDLRRVFNRVISVNATITVKDATVIKNTTELTQNMRESLSAYFDERPDFYRWNTNSIRAALVSTDPDSILTCSSVTVLDSDGNPMSEPTVPDANGYVYHYLLNANALTVTFNVPT